MTDQDKTKAQLISELVELRRSEAKWRSVAENAPLFLAVLDEAGKMQFLNRFQPGLEPATVIGKDFCDFLQPEYHDVARNCLKQVFRTGEAASYETIGAGPDGTLAHYVTNVGPVILDGTIIAATLISKDITERKRAEAELRREHQRAQQYLDVAGVIMVVLDNRGDIRLLNRKGYSILGYDDGDLLGRNWFETCVPEECVMR